jgi:hypothetical protein
VKRLKCISQNGFDHSRAFLKSKITQEFNIPCYDPPNGTTINIPTQSSRAPIIHPKVLEKYQQELINFFDDDDDDDPKMLLKKVVNKLYSDELPQLGGAIFEHPQTKV